MTLQSTPRRKAQVIAQKASNDFMLFNMDSGNYYSLNDVGSRIWELCDGNHTVTQMVAALAAEYAAPSEMLEADVLELLENLRSGELVMASGGPESSVK